MIKTTKTLLLKAFGIEWPHWTNVVLWVIGVSIMTGMTVKDLRPLILNYYDVEENTQVQIKLRTQDEMFKEPDIHFCLPLPDFSDEFFTFGLGLFNEITNGIKCEQCEALTNRSYDVWNRHDPNESLAEMILRSRNVTTLDEVSELLIDGFVGAIATNDIGNNPITLGNLSWNRPLVYSLIEYLRRETEMEKQLMDRLRLSETSLSAGGNASISRSTSSAERLDTLYSLLVHFVCEFVHISNWAVNSRGNMCSHRFDVASFVYKSLSLAENSTLFCGYLVLDQLDDSNVIVDERLINGHVDEKRRFFALMENPMYDDKISNILYGTAEGIENNVIITFSPQYTVVEERPRKLRTCYNESTKAHCEFKCCNERVQSICGCQPYTYSRRSFDRVAYDRTKHCAYEDLVICYQRLENITDDETLSTDPCSERCTHACRSNVYQWQVNTDLVGSTAAASVTLLIQARRQSYLEFNMTVKDSNEDLISQIGGVFNFYLGISGLSIIFFLVSLIDISRKIVSHKRHNGNADHTESQSDAATHWRWRWAKLMNSIPAQQPVPEFEKKFSELKQALETRMVRLETNESAIEESMEKFGRELDNLSSEQNELHAGIREIQRLLFRENVVEWSRRTHSCT